MTAVAGTEQQIRRFISRHQRQVLAGGGCGCVSDADMECADDQLSAASWRHSNSEWSQDEGSSVKIHVVRQDDSVWTTGIAWNSRQQDFLGPALSLRVMVEVSIRLPHCTHDRAPSGCAGSGRHESVLWSDQVLIL